MLEPLASKAKSLDVYADDQDQASAWVLDLGASRFVLAVTREATRGFSGEGQALRTLAALESSPVLRSAVAAVRAALAWQPALDVEALSLKTGVDDPARVRAALEILGASGLVGYDLARAAYFHRVLPYDLSGVDLDNPRLVAARDLVARGAVKRRDASFAVASGDVDYIVREVEAELVCSCPWAARHEGERGPCKHVLAIEMTLEAGARP